MSGHRLDRAIDHVAKRLTQVDEDAQFASRIIAALPDRLTWFGWLMHARAPRLAMLAVVAGPFAFWSMRHTTEVTPAPQPLATVANVNWPQLAASIAPEGVAPVRTMFVERVERMEPLEPFVGLPSVAAPKALAVNDIAPEALPVEGALAVSSLVIADLPLTAESFSQRD